MLIGHFDSRPPSRQNVLQLMLNARIAHIIILYYLVFCMIHYYQSCLTFVVSLLCSFATMYEVYSFTVYYTYMSWIVRFFHPSFGLIATLPMCISSYRFECWVPIERHWLGMHIMIVSLNGALPLNNTILAYVLHELRKAQSTMLLLRMMGLHLY